MAIIMEKHAGMKTYPSQVGRDDRKHPIHDQVHTRRLSLNWAEWA